MIIFSEIWLHWSHVIIALEIIHQSMCCSRDAVKVSKSNINSCNLYNHYFGSKKIVKGKKSEENERISFKCHQVNIFRRADIRKIVSVLTWCDSDWSERGEEKNVFGHFFLLFILLLSHIINFCMKSYSNFFLSFRFCFLFLWYFVFISPTIGHIEEKKMQNKEITKRKD